MSTTSLKTSGTKWRSLNSNMDTAAMILRVLIRGSGSAAALTNLSRDLTNPLSRIVRISDVSGPCVLRIEMIPSTTTKVTMTPTMSMEADMTITTNVPMQASGIAVIQTNLSQV